MASALERALPRVPAWVDEQTIAHLDEPIKYPAAAEELNLHTITYQTEGNGDLGEQILATTSLDTISVIPPDISDKQLQAAIERTRNDRHTKRRSLTERVIVSTPKIAETIRSAFPNTPILDSSQLDGLVKPDKLFKRWGAQLTDVPTIGSLLLHALIVDRVILSKDRGRAARFNHVNSEARKILPSAIKTAALLYHHPDAIYVQKNYEPQSLFECPEEDIPVLQMLQQLDLDPSSNYILRRALMDHVPLTTGQYGQDLLTMIVAGEYADWLRLPLGKVLDVMDIDEQEAERKKKSAAYRELRDVLKQELRELDLQRLIDLQPQHYQRINEEWRNHDQSAALGQLLPDLYTLIKENIIDLGAVRELEIQLHSRQFPGLQKKERRTTLGMSRIVKSVLPNVLPLYVFGYPTYDRWHTSLPGAIGSVGYKAARDGIAKDSAFMIADGTPDISDDSRTGHLRRFYERDGYVPNIPIYILTPEDQLKVIAEVERRTGLSKEDITAVIGGTSCGDNRQKLVVAAGSYIMDQHGSVILGLMDDDLEVHQNYSYARRFGNIPNSQVILDANRDQGVLFQLQPNGSLKKDFLDIPGQTLKQLRRNYPDMPASETWIDLMHRQLDEAQQTGVAGFLVMPDGPPIHEATVWGISAVKHLRPDYRTIKVAKDFLLNEFPDQEVAMASYPAGPSSLFAFRECNTNVDLAFSAWQVDTDTVKLPYAFIISRAISLQNPYQTVTTNSRADNELQPTLLPRVLGKTGKSYVYVTGSPLRVEHHREPSGYRPTMIEQACTSLVDNLYAQAANEMMEFDEEGFPYLPDEAIDNYSIPEERARGVFRQLQELAQTASFKTLELSQRRTYSAEEEARLTENLQRYKDIIESLRFKLGVKHYEEESGEGPVTINDWDNVAFLSWKEQIDIIGRKQLHYYGRVLKNTPIITRAVHEIIREGKYPVSVMIPNGDLHISLSGQPTRRQSL